MMVVWLIRRFLLPAVLVFGGFAIVAGGMDWAGLGEGDQLFTAVTSFLIILAGVFPVVLVAMLFGKSNRNRAMILMGGSLAKLIIIGFLILVVRRAMLSFADKNSFFIWLFLSFLVVSSLGWFVVAAKALPGEESGQA